MHVKVGKLTGVYSSPHRVLEYADGNRYHTIALNFDAEVIGGEMTISDETKEIGYFSIEEIHKIDLMSHHQKRITDALENTLVPFIR